MGLLRAIAGFIASIIEAIEPDSRQFFAIILVSWVSAVTSAFIDNIPFTTTMIPVIRQIAENVEGINIDPLIWSLAGGACLGGMGTLIGASSHGRCSHFIMRPCIYSLVIIHTEHTGGLENEFTTHG